MAATTTYKAKLTYPQVFLWRMSLFLILAILLAIILDGQTQQLRTSFMANPGLNALIIGVLIVGIIYSFRQVLRLYPEIRWVNSFRISDPGLSVDTTPVLLAPMATMRRALVGCFALSFGAPPVGVFLVLRRLSLMGDAMATTAKMRWIKVGAAAAVAAIVVASLLPANWQLRTGLPWQIEHFLAYFTVTSISVPRLSAAACHGRSCFRRAPRWGTG